MGVLSVQLNEVTKPSPKKPNANQIVNQTIATPGASLSRIEEIWYAFLGANRD